VISSKTGGWAANAHLQARLADFGTVDMVGQTSTPGWGSIEKKVNEGLEKLTDEYLGGKGFSPGEDYGWSFGKLLVYDKGKLESIKKALEESLRVLKPNGWQYMS
jgi:hypothetical protein